jgi:hypothetical protein
MKQLIYLFSFLLLTSISISSCKKSSSSNNSIVGDWELIYLNQVSVDSTTTPITVTKTDTTVTHGHSIVISFFADNTFSEYDYTSYPPSLSESGTYVALGDSLTIFDGSSTTGSNLGYKVSGNLLTISINSSSPGSSSSATEKLNRL